jgi:hypothetical protein
MPDSLFLGVALLLGVGSVMRVFGLPSLIAGIRPVVAPEFAAEFVGDFLIGLGFVLLGLGLLDRAVSLPEVVWLAFGLVVVGSVVALPKLAGLYARTRDWGSEDV